MEKTLGSAQHKALIEFLIKQREEVGMTQAELADAIGEYQSFVARVESGQRRIDVVEFIHLAEVLDFNAQEILETIMNV